MILFVWLIGYIISFILLRKTLLRDEVATSDYQNKNCRYEIPGSKWGLIGFSLLISLFTWITIGVVAAWYAIVKIADYMEEKEPPKWM